MTQDVTPPLSTEVWVAGLVLRNVARNVADAFDEFWPEYPEAVGEHVQALDAALERFGLLAAGEPAPVPERGPLHWAEVAGVFLRAGSGAGGAG